MAVELRPSDREDPFGDLAGLSLFPHTLSLASPVPQRQEQESFQNLFDSMAAKGSKNIVEDACTISTSYSKNQHLYVETEDKDRITDLKGNKENSQGRRPALGRKRARFSLKPISRDSSVNSGIYDIVEPQEYFTAVDQMQKAEEELKKCQSGAAADLAPHHPSPTVRNRRHGILGRTASYKHHLSDNADATITLKMLQEDIPGQGIPSPATVSAYTELHLETTEKGISPSMEPKSELFGDTRGQGIVTEKGSIDDVLEKLFSSFKDFNGDNGVKLLQEKLRAKSRNLGKITLPEPDGIQRSNPRILKSTTIKGLDGSQLSEQTSAITSRSPLAVIANLQRRISLKDPLSDPYAMPLSDDESCLGEAMGQKIPLSSSADMNHVVTNNIPADDAFTPEIVRGKRTSFVEKIHLSAHDANRTINKKIPSEEDNVEHSPYMCTNSVDSCGFSNLENNVAAGRDGPSAKESDTVVKELTSEFVTQNDMVVLASPPSMNTSSNISKIINASASSFGGDATLQDEVNVTLEGETESHAKDSEESSRRRSSRKIGQNINNSGNGGASSSQRDTVLQEVVNVIVQGEAVSSAEVSSGSLVGNTRNLSTNPEEDASPLSEFLPENQPSTIVPEENNEAHMLQETSGVSPVGVRKRKAPLNAKSKKKSTSNRQSNSRRQSLADAGFTWKSGVRRSTRIKTRPLQHWCGEKVLYGRVHNSMITVIGMRGTFKADVKIVDNETISVDGKLIKVVANRDPLQLPWAEMGIDIVIEGTGVFVDGPGAGKHLQAGAKKVIITAPAKGADIPTYVVGVNEKDYHHEVANIISNASCTTNCLAPFVKVIDEEFGIVKGTMTTTHSYTGDQRLLDASHRDLRRARAAALNIVPTSTGAAKAVSLVLPQLKGKLNGIALRVPTPNVSVVDLVVNVAKKGISAEDVNAAFRKAAEGPLNGVLSVCDEPLVSVDFRCTDVSSTIDSSLTMVMGDDMVKVVAWYDNEWGYSQRVVDLAHLVADKWQGTPVGGSGDPLEDFCQTNPATEECKVYEA